MEFLIPLIPFVVAGVVVIFIAFWGGPSAAREAYLTRGRRGFTITMLVLYAGLGIAVPAAVIAARGESVGGTGSLRSEEVSGTLEDGKQLFIQTCKSCHTLAAVDAHGVTGPNLDELGGPRQAARPTRDQDRRDRRRPDAAGAPHRGGCRCRCHICGGGRPVR